MNLFHRSLLALFLFASASSFAQQRMDANDTSWKSLTHEVPVWLQDAKFGIYFHWGPYTVPAFNSEWYSRSMYVPNTEPNKRQVAQHGPLKTFGYKDFIPLFKAEKFNADEWASLFLKAGARFAGPVAEHADGFSMWNSKVNRWNAKEMGPKQDIAGVLEKSIRQKGMKFITTFHHQWQWGWYPTFDTNTDAADKKFAGLYGPLVSPSAWQHKDSAEKPDAAFCTTWAAKVNEVVSTYHPDLIYFDSRLAHIQEDFRKEVVRNFYKNDKGNQRIVLYKGFDLPLGIGLRTYEKSRMNKLNEKPWLTEEPISTFSWSYTEDMELRPADDILKGLIDVVSKNGIYLLNISPTAQGIIPQKQQDILLAIGNWLSQNGEAIYGTRPWYTYGEGPRKEGEEKGTIVYNRREYFKQKYTAEDIRYTSKDKAVYAIVLGKPQEGKPLMLKAFGQAKLNEKNIKKIELLSTHETVKWQLNNEGLQIQVPVQLTETMATVFKIEMKEN